MRPFLKWPGGKYRLVPKIKEKLPTGRRLIEPFAGSCAVSLNTEYENYLINDINEDLINLYKTLQAKGDKFIRRCRLYFTDKKNTPEKFKEFRKQFNKIEDIETKSVLLLYLNRHGYNGLIRYNSQGEFNVPFGRYKKPYFPEEEMKFFYEKFKKAKFTCIDFEEIMMKAKPGDVIYCDPPYIPLTSTSNFTSYSSGGFGIGEQERLARVAAKVAAKGIPVIISNHKMESIIQLYKGADIEQFPVRRFISCNGANRNAVTEILAVFGRGG